MMNRRRFLKNTALIAALHSPLHTFRGNLSGPARPSSADDDSFVIDTNLHLFPYPFRDMKYGKTGDLIAKLKRHRIGRAWAGSHRALFHKNIDHVNRTLASECREHGEGLLIPFGTVNPVFPDWREDLRRCAESYGMPGIRLYPGFHGYTLGDPSFLRLAQLATEHGMLIQITIAMEDERMQHPLVDVPAVDVTPLPEVLKQVPDARIQLLHPFRHVRGERLHALIKHTGVCFDISNLDGSGGLELVMAGEHPYVSDIPVPAERLLFGSHMPYFPLENSLFKFMESDPDEERSMMILRGNARRLLEIV